MKQRYLVTGGAGFVGSNLVDQLLARGHHVTVLDNLSTGSLANLEDAAKHDDYMFIKGDITYWQGLATLFLESHDSPTIDPFDGIFHLAGMPRIQPSFSNPIHSINSNCQGTANVLELARKQGARLVYAGSSSFYHNVYANPYSFSKWQGEELCKLYRAVYKTPVAIARFFNVYGPRQLDDGAYSTVIGIFERQYKNGEPLTITGDGEQRRDFCVTGDTLVLMKGMIWKRIDDIQVGEEVVSYMPTILGKRLFKTSKVTAASNYCSSNVYEIVTESGTVKATGNHPWLQDRRGFRDTDWLLKQLSGGVHKSLKKFSDPIICERSDKYKDGYLVGAIDGDGYCYKSKKSPHIGLEVCDKEFSDRFIQYCVWKGIDLRTSTRQPSYDGSRLCYVARSSRTDSFQMISSISRDFASLDFCNGYMAAIYDGEGEYDSYHNKGLRISNTDKIICDNIRNILSRHRFKWSERRRKDGLIYFRLLGGLNEEVRFLATFGPAVSRKSPDIDKREVKGKLDRILSIRKINPSRVFNIEVENTHTYIANGFLCHNTHISDIVNGLIAIDERHLRPRVFNNTNVNFESHHTLEVYSTAYSENEPAKIFNLGTGTNYSINEVAAMFPNCKTTYIPKRPGEAWTTLADISFTQSLLHWSPQHSLSDYIKNVTAH